MENFTQLFFEILLLIFLAIVYFYYQKSRIIKHSKWGAQDWEFVYSEALNTLNPEEYRDLNSFLNSLETILNSKKYPPLTWFDEWRNSQLPTNLIQLFPNHDNK